MTGTTQARYEVIEEWLAALCDSLGTGAILPTEVEVAERFNVSRMTARHAFQNLADKGRIERRRGSGSVVRSAPLHRQEAVLRAFTDEMRRRGMAPSSRVVRAELGTNPAAAEQLGLSPIDWVVTIQRVRLADSVPLALETATLPGDFAEVLQADLEHGSLHAALTRLGRTMVRATGYVTARLATLDEARLLDITQPAALLVETRLIADAAGRRVESTETAYVGTRWAIDTGSFVSVEPLTKVGLG